MSKFEKTKKRIIMLHKPHPSNIMDKGAIEDLLKKLIEMGEL